MAVADISDKLSTIDEIIGRTRKKSVTRPKIRMILRVLEISALLFFSGSYVYQMLLQNTPMSQPQGTILRTLSEKVATIRGERAGGVWEDIRGGLGISRDTYMSRGQWILAVRALAAEIDRH